MSIGGFLLGMAVGLLAGLLVGPVLHTWLTWREWRDASQEARLTEDVMRVMGDGPWRTLDRRSHIPHRHR